ncbi:transposase [Streptomyces phaeolivaceus]|uniref:transposase n=1 Tax=Streptomyces phaeolivaceus TaxID=2653200 RepID=UPI001D03EBE7|nr:transposase [Streptomyces phaeolivaceus]
MRRVRPTRRHLKKLTVLEKKTGWRYCISATNIRHMWGIAGSGHSQFLDVLHRSHAGVEDRVRTNKATGLDNLPSASWEVNRGWMLAANLASDLDAWVRLLTLHDVEGLTDAEPKTMRFRLYHLPACPPRRPRPTPMAAYRRDLALGKSVHHLLAAAHHPPNCHLTAGYCRDKDQEGEDRQHSGPVEPGAPAASRDGPPRTARGHYGRTAKRVSHRTPLTIEVSRSRPSWRRASAKWRNVRFHDH